VNTYEGWVIMQGTGSPPSYRAERMLASPWHPTKNEVIEWIKAYEQCQRTIGRATNFSIVPQATGDTRS